MNVKLALPTFLYLILPLILVPLWAYSNGSWLMLLGILASYFGSLCFFQDFGSVIFVLFVAVIAYSVLLLSSFDIHDLFTTLFLCMFYGFVTTAIYKRERELQKLKKDIEENN